MAQNLTLDVDGKVHTIAVDDPKMPFVPVSAVAKRKITTLAGLGTPEKPHKLQTAWIEEQVNQCAYCINGWIMTGAELLARNPHPTDGEIRDAFSDLICRCGTHIAAVGGQASC